MEFPYSGWPLELRELVFRLVRAASGIVLAHPERNAEVQEEPERLRPIVDAGVLVQLTAASVDGRLGRAPAAASRALLDARLAHLIASDAHAPSIRAIGMTAAAEAVGDEALARWLTHDVPAAVSRALPCRSARRRAVCASAGTSAPPARSSGFWNAITLRAAASSVAPVAKATSAPCVLASLGARAPEARQHSLKGH